MQHCSRSTVMDILNQNSADPASTTTGQSDLIPLPDNPLFTERNDDHYDSLFDESHLDLSESTLTPDPADLQYPFRNSSADEKRKTGIVGYTFLASEYEASRPSGLPSQSENTTQSILESTQSAALDVIEQAAINQNLIEILRSVFLPTVLNSGSAHWENKAAHREMD